MAPVLGERESNKAKRQLLVTPTIGGNMAALTLEGRIFIPALLRESAGMQGEVAVMGQMEYLEVWNRTSTGSASRLPSRSRMKKGTRWTVWESDDSVFLIDQR